MLHIVAKPDKPCKETQLDEDISGDTSGYFKKLLISAAQVLHLIGTYTPNCYLCLFFFCFISSQMK
jgi:hypothetical protein